MHEMQSQVYPHREDMTVGFAGSGYESDSAQSFREGGEVPEMKRLRFGFVKEGGADEADCCENQAIDMAAPLDEDVVVVELW